MLRTVVVFSGLLTCLSSAADAQEAKWVRAPANEAVAVPDAVREAESAGSTSPEAPPLEAAASGTAVGCATGVAEQTLHANNVMARLYNTGHLFWKMRGNFYEAPAYSGNQAIFLSGIWIGGMVGDELRFAGTDYGPFEFWPGPLDEQGNPPEDCLPYDRIFRVSRPDLRAYDAGAAATPDMQDWPWILGAPVDDGDGIPDNYDLSAGDRPRVLGHQTAWWVTNDAGGTHGWSQTPPIRMEVQTTAFAVSTSDALDNTTFYRYRLIYRGAEPLADAWFGLFSVSSLGDDSDDFVGSDTTLNMGYVYNAREFDAHYGARPPALGHVFLQGPVVDVENGRRSGMSSFLTYKSGGGPTSNPTTAAEAYGYLRGIWLDGRPITEGGFGYGGEKVTRFMYTGDPTTGSYWSEVNADGTGRANLPSYQRYVMSTGPFSMNPGDVQDIVIAMVWSQDEDHLQSVARLREDAAFVIDAFNNGSIDQYPVPEMLPVRRPNYEFSPEDINVSLARGESTTRDITITNTGTADLWWNIQRLDTPIARFLTTANGAGPLDPPDTGTFSFNNNGFPTPDGEMPHCTQDQMIDHATCNDRPSHQQQVGPGRWGINVGGGNGTFDSYMSRSILGRSPEQLGRFEGFDFEWRFTGTSTAVRGFEDDQVVEVPFEIWNTGRATPDDPSDDVRMIPLICETACGGGHEPMVFDIGSDHPVSGGANDPLSDWVYWYNPADLSPGEGGYHKFVNGGDINLDELGGEVLAHQVLVSFNAGAAPPYEQPLPEPGTIFRIESAKRWLRIEGAESGKLSGSIPPGGSDVITLFIDSRFIQTGAYLDSVRITTGVLDKPALVVRVHLDVLPGTTAIDGSSELPQAYTLDQNYPNPFNPSTTIRFGLPAAGPVRLVLYDVLGRQVRVLVDEIRAAGWHSVAFDAGDLPTGAYFYRLDADSYREVRSMLLVK